MLSQIIPESGIHGIIFSFVYDRCECGWYKKDASVIYEEEMGLNQLEKRIQEDIAAQERREKEEKEREIVLERKLLWESRGDGDMETMLSSDEMLVYEQWCSEDMREYISMYGGCFIVDDPVVSMFFCFITKGVVRFMTVLLVAKCILKDRPLQIIILDNLDGLCLLSIGAKKLGPAKTKRIKDVLRVM